MTQGLLKIKLRCQLEPWSRGCFTEVESGLHFKQPALNILNFPELDTPLSPLWAQGAASWILCLLSCAYLSWDHQQPLGKKAHLSLRCFWCCSMSGSERKIWDWSNNVDIRAFQTLSLLCRWEPGMGYWPCYSTSQPAGGLLAILQQICCRAVRRAQERFSLAAHLRWTRCYFWSVHRGRWKCVLVGAEVGRIPDRYLVGFSSLSSYQPVAVPGWSPDFWEVL